MKHTLLSIILSAGVLSVGIAAAFAQSDRAPRPLDPNEIRIIGNHEATQHLALKGISIGEETPVTQPAEIPLASYSVKASRDGNTYTGQLVGTSPFASTKSSTTVPVVIIPVSIHITQGGNTYVFGPRGTDPGCLGGSNTALSLVQNSPIFQNWSFHMNGIAVGDTQYPDAHMRGEFWQYVNGTNYHVLLSYTVGSLLTINVTGDGSNAEVYSVPAGNCTNGGYNDPAGYLGVVDINTVDAALQSYISSQKLTPAQFPLFVTYDAVISEGGNTGNCCILGYHNALGNPGQTYGIADWQANAAFGGGIYDTSVLAHEVSEWMNDPGGSNMTPAWGHIGQQSGCQNNFEVGDPLTGTDRPTVTLNGFTYHLQELAFFSWFYGHPSIGAGGLYSNNKTFTSDAGSVCSSN